MEWFGNKNPQLHKAGGTLATIIAMRYLIILFLAFLLANCNRKAEQNVKNQKVLEPKILTKKNNIHEIETKNTIIDTLEIFKDSASFGKKKKSKILITKMESGEKTFVNIYLFKKFKNKWTISDSLILDNIDFPKLNPEITDFNNDGFNDIIFTSGTAARGANNVQTLILYDKNDKLKWMRNSEYYPNLMYNSKLNCIDALIFTGGLTTVFLKIEKDSLKEFAKVEQRDGRIIVKTIDENGKRTEIKNIIDKTKNDFKRFIDFKPLEERK
jgi:hypothetical protein